MAGNLQLFVVSILTALFAAYNLYRRNQIFVRFPPGPRRLPLFGNLTDLPTSQQWVTYAKWRGQYGDLIGLVVLGQPIVVINSIRTAFDLLNKRGSIYLDRPGFSLIQEWGGWNWMLTTMQYGEEWKLQRKMFAQQLNPKCIQEFHHVIYVQAAKLASRLLCSPEKFQDHTRLFAGANILMITYGHEVVDNDDEWVKLARDANASLEVLTNVGAHPVDIFPWLRHFPMNIFGGKFARQMRHMRNLAEQLVERPYTAVKDEVLCGRGLHSSMAHRLIDSCTSAGITAHEETIRGALAGVYVAGADTIISTIDTAILALMLNPDIQKEAQHVLDAVLCGQRLPSLEDRPKFPYVDAILRETLRWNPVAPLAAPHRLVQEDIYENMVFPAGTTFIANSWQMLHDEATYPNPTEFSPNRFLRDDGTLRDDILDPREIAFGFGRRICPGRHLAESSLWVTIAMILYLFDLTIPLDEKGEPIRPDLTYISALISHPTPFQCVFTPRSHTARLLLDPKK
ncbi:cytochrome P450 [Suillus subluteus]|nr:cytochrome P450 [Suillus subluteus]